MSQNFKLIGGLLYLLLVPIILACSGKSELAPVTVADVEQPSTKPPATKSAPPKKPATELNARIAVGDKAPSFRLADQHGNERSLDELLAVSKVALVFFRSADW